MELVGALDVGATKTLVAVRPLPLRDWQPGAGVRKVPTPRDPVACADLVSAILLDLAGEAGGKLIAVGCGTPGPLDTATGTINRSANLGWEEVPLGRMLEERLGVPTRFDDDGNSGGLGEATLGAGRGTNPCVYVAIGTGIGAGAIIDGVVLHGAHAAGAELGHLVVDPAGPLCGCGHGGCVEAFASGSGLAGRIAATWPAGRRADGSQAPATPGELFEAARRGDAASLAIVEQAIEALAKLFGALGACFDPETIVIGGSVGIGQRRFIRRAADRSRAYCLAEAGSAVRFEFASLGGDSVLAGAAVLAARAVAGGAIAPGVAAPSR